MSGCTQESCWACWCVYRTYVIGQVWRSACFGVWTEQMKTGHKEPFSLAAFGSYFNTNNCGIVLSLSLWEWHGDSPMQQSQVAMEGGSNGLVCSILKMKPRKDVWSQMICLGLFVSVLVDPVKKIQACSRIGLTWFCSSAEVCSGQTSADGWLSVILLALDDESCLSSSLHRAKLETVKSVVLSTSWGLRAEGIGILLKYQPKFLHTHILE